MEIVKTGFGGLFVACLLLGAAEAKAGGTPGQRLKVLQFNCNDELVILDDHDHFVRDIRFAALKHFIETESPDIIMFDEGFSYHKYPSFTIPLAEQMGYDQAYRIGLGLPGFLWDSNSVLVKKKFNMTQVRDTILSHSAIHIGDPIHGQIALGSYSHVIGAKLTLDNGEPLFIYSTHLIGKTLEDKADQSQDMVNAIEKQIRDNGVDPAQAHVLIGGDFNAGPTSKVIGNVLQAGYTDTWAIAHPDHFADDISATGATDPYTAVYNPMTLGARQIPDQSEMAPNERIDWVFSRGPDTTILGSTMLFTRPYGGFWMSDHYGVYSTIAIGDDNGPPVGNPVTDSDSNLAGPTHLIEVTDALLASCAKHKVCDLTSAATKVGSRGVTVINKSSHTLDAKLWGAGRVLPSKTAHLKPGHVGSFVFITEGAYTAGIKVAGKKLRGALEYQAD